MERRTGAIDRASVYEPRQSLFYQQARYVIAGEMNESSACLSVGAPKACSSMARTYLKISVAVLHMLFGGTRGELTYLGTPVARWHCAFYTSAEGVPMLAF